VRVVVTGQVGLDKKDFLQRAVAAAEQMGRRYRLFNVGDRMYAEAPDVPPGRILELPPSRLNALRRSVFKDLLAEASAGDDIVVNTHATFRWRHGLFYAFDYDQMKALNADLYVTLVDNVDRVHARLVRDGHTEHTLKDLMVWREEEILATELLANLVRGHGRFCVLARGNGDSSARTLARLIAASHLKTAYLSYPMSHVAHHGQLLAEIEHFRGQVKRHFVCFDPADLDEKYLAREALGAAEQGRRFLTRNIDGAEVTFETAEVLGILGDIDGQIYARDFKLIDQSELTIAFIPQLPAGPDGHARPAISSGVERELQHAHEAAKEVFVIWRPQAEPSPFITQTANRVFRSTDEAVRFFLTNNYVPPPPSGRLFE